MKALSIVRPAGTQIANGLKTLEIRRWQPEIRAGEEILLVENEHFLTVDGQEDVGTAVTIITLMKSGSLNEKISFKRAHLIMKTVGWLGR
ncbi:hypothetical protein OGM23_08695 [Dickeya fangzhongdai]|uniref:hypothetical protein n=1 Tax=Dickeya fangzhongdai TaxID=1778540 RepID=UPI002B2C6A38|nr:hypothetical protein OGM23_08695 [Dickeya fangzhongdai]